MCVRGDALSSLPPSPPVLPLPSPPPSAVILIRRERAAIGAAVRGGCSFSHGNGKKKMMKSEISGFLFSSRPSFSVIPAGFLKKK